jgi:hypothetical protein
MKELTKEEYRLFKDRLYRASNALTLSFESCPELEHFSITLKDGHQLSLIEVFAWIEAARSECWKYGPSEIRLRHIKQIINQQPRG